MNELPNRAGDEYPPLTIRIYTVNGVTRTFTGGNGELVNRALNELHPSLLFTLDRIAIADKNSHTVLPPSLLTRIDLIGNRLSFRDFPCAIGAGVKLGEMEFVEGLAHLERSKQSRLRSNTPAVLDLELLDGQRLFLFPEVDDSLSGAHPGGFYSLLRERGLLFGLRTGGVGILNLANLWRFSVHPEPAAAANIGQPAHDQIGRQMRILPITRTCRRLNHGHVRRAAPYRRVNFNFPEGQ